VDQGSDGSVTASDTSIRAVVEVLDRDGRARLTLPVRRWPVTVGRAVTCDIVLDDPYVAAQHATLTELDGGGLQLVVGDTVNGVLLKKTRVPSGERIELAAGDVVQVGGTRLRVRRAADALSPERRWVPEASGSARTVLLLGVLFTAWTAGELWLRDDPGGRLTDYLPVLIGGPVAVGIWAAFWSVGSKLVRHRFDFWSHSRIALLGTIAMGVAGLLLPVFAFTSGWAWPSRLAPMVSAAIGWSVVGAHIGRILPGRPRVLAGVMASLFVVGLGLYSFHHYETQDRVFPELYVATLAPPALRLAPTVPTARFVDEAKALKAALEAHVTDDERSGGN
jgi:hypothetical protein